MIHIQYQLVAGVGAGTTVIVPSGNTTVHTVCSPIATLGLIELKDPVTFASVVSFPIGTIGTMLLDASFPKGLTLRLSGADTAIVTYQIP